MIHFIGNNLFEYQGVKNSTIEECIIYLRTKKVIGLDIETSRKYRKGLYENTVYTPGLDPYLSKIIMLQIGDLENQFVIDTRVINIEPLREIIESEQILKVGHNLKFETKMIRCNHGIMLKNIHDTMIIERVLYNGYKLSYSLEALISRYFGKKSISDVSLFDEIDEEYEEEEIIKNDLDLIDYKETKYIDKSVRLQFLNIGDTPFTLEQVIYGVEDITYPLRIRDIQLKGVQITPEDLYLPLTGLRMENTLTPILGRIELRGVNINIQGWLDLYQVNRKIYVEKVHNLNNWIIKHYPEFSLPDLFIDIGTCSIDWQSPKQVIRFARFLNFCPREYSKQTKKVEYSVSAKVLFKLLNNPNKDRFFKNETIPLEDKDDIQAFILNYLLTKKYQQLTTTFGEDWLKKYIHPITHKVHTNYMQLMNTGRLSSIAPNLQNIPSGKDFRELFISPTGYDMISCDYSAQELRVLAQVTKVESLMDFFNIGHPIYKDDIHSFSASRMFSVMRNEPNLIIDPILHKNERSISKKITFGLSFGAGSPKISSDFGISMEEAEAFIQAFFDGFPGLQQNFDETKKIAYERGWIELDPFTGKRYFFPQYQEMMIYYHQNMSYFPEGYSRLPKSQRDIIKTDLKIKHPDITDTWRKWGKLKGSLERRALNYRIQGNASSISKIAMIALDKDNTSIEFGVLLVVHDEIISIHPKNISIEMKDKIREVMIKSAIHTCPDVIMDAKADLGDHWIH